MAHVTNWPRDYIQNMYFANMESGSTAQGECYDEDNFFMISRHRAVDI